MLYRKILSQTWRIVWRHKYLWFFGFFAAILGSVGEYEILARGLGNDANLKILSGWQSLAETGIFSKQAAVNISQLMLNDSLSLIKILAAGFFIFAVLCFLIYLAVVSQSALVNNAALYWRNKNFILRKDLMSDFKKGVARGREKFWPVFGLSIIIRLIVYLAFILVGLPVTLLAMQSKSLGVNLLYIITFIIFVPIALALSFIIKYSIAYIVVKGENFIQAIKSGWQLFIKNWLVSIEMAFILFFINFFVGLFLALFILVLTVPFLFLAIAFYKLVSVIGLWFVIILGLIVFLAIIILGGAILVSFQISAWTGLFMELVGKGGTSKIVRVFSKK